MLNNYLWTDSLLIHTLELLQLPTYATLLFLFSTFLNLTVSWLKSHFFHQFFAISPHYCVYSFPCILIVCSCDSIHWILWEKQCNNVVKSSDSRARLKLNPDTVTYWLCGLCYLTFLYPNFLICSMIKIIKSTSQNCCNIEMSSYMSSAYHSDQHIASTI